MNILIRTFKATLRLSSIFPFIAALLLTGCSGSSSDHQKSFSVVMQSQFQRILEEKRAETGAAGAVLLVRDDEGREWTGSVGISESFLSTVTPDPDGTYHWEGVPLDESLVFRIGSLTKMFGAALILRLIDQELLTLEDTVDQWIPGAVRHSDIITVRRLLNHTSGVADFSAAPGFSENEAWTPEDLLALVTNSDPQFLPGEHFLYTNTNYLLLGMIAEAVTGQAYEELVRTELLDVLGLRHTYVPTTPDFPEAHAYGYEMQDDNSFVEVVGFQPTAPWAAGSMISNLNDLATWVEKLFGGALLSPETQQELLDFVSVNDNIWYGLGVIKYSDGRLGHSGSIQGFYAGAWRVNGHTVVSLSNSRMAQDTANMICAAVAERVQSP
jgi:D-alanyl-D-alanine carboxypeptidase